MPQSNSTSGHESEAINVADLKATFQKFKTDVHDALGLKVVNGQLCQTYNTSGE